MDLDKMLRHVGNLNDYISVTQEVAKHAGNSSKVQFNMSTVLLLKKVRALEIEYFNKYDGNGAALFLFERMVEQPSSKTWELLGKEIVSLLQYWLDAIRKHLIRHNLHWWTFLKQLLNFIKIIRMKGSSLPDILVEGTTEGLLDLATTSSPDILQRYEILCCLNLYCSDASREIRFALRKKLETYFVKLTTLLTSCGCLPAQYSALETLVRWMVPRNENSVREAAAARFPEDICGRKALKLFMERPWLDFFQDARDFLNACNEQAELVTSVVCRKATVGSIVVVTGTERRATWLDVNSSNKSVSLVLDPRILVNMGVTEVTSWGTLAVGDDDVTSVQLFRESSEATMVVLIKHAPRLRPSGDEVAGSSLKMVLSSSSDLRRLDKALRQAFGNKYQVTLDLDKQTLLSPQDYRDNTKILPSLEEDTRFSHPAEVRRRMRSGVIVRTRNPVSWQSPSTASTTSLAQLHEKLASLPHYKFDKEAVHVCALPALSTVTEISETDDRQSFLNTQSLITNRPAGVCQKNFKTSDRNSQSDGETNVKPNKLGRNLSPVDQDEEHSTNCLLVATIGSADESVINDTIERLTKNKDFRSDNIVNLLVQEALQRDYNEKEFLDSGINTGDNTKKTEQVDEVNSETIEETQLQKQNVEVETEKSKEHCTVISNTTTDESNDVVCETQHFINFRKRNPRSKLEKEEPILEVVNENEGQMFNEIDVEKFFSQHIAENNRGEIVISPTLARKINESSSESESFEDCLLMRKENDCNVDLNTLQGFEVVECLNSIVDKVCSDFDKWTELLNRETEERMVDACDITGTTNPPDIIPLTDISHRENIVPETQLPEPKPKTQKAIKLKYTAKKVTKITRKRANAKKSNKLELESTSKMSPIKELSITEPDPNESKTPEREQPVQSPKMCSPTSKSDVDTPLIRRKRKLYSPKYENINDEGTSNKEDVIDDFKTSKRQTPKYNNNSTCYKDIEATRKNRIRQPRQRKSVAKSNTPSPRTKKNNDMFDQLKEKLECPVKLVSTDKKIEKDLATYNFTSDSEDEDFKKKKIEIQKRISTTTIASGDSAMSTRHGRTVNRINYTENKSSDETVKGTTTKQKKTVRRKRTPRSRLPKTQLKENQLIDEKMRKAAPDDLNISMIAEKPKEIIPEEPKLILNENPEMEAIPDETITEVKSVIENTEKQKNQKMKKQKKTEVLSLKKEKKLKSVLDVERDNDDRTISPLPGLVIEQIPAKAEDDSITANMIEKLKKLQQAGSDVINNETNTTHNLLSDVEQRYSPITFNVTDEFNKFGNVNGKVCEVSNDLSQPLNSNASKQVTASNPKEIEKAAILRVKKEKSDQIREQRKSRTNTSEVINLSDTPSEKSIATVGKSPITAHGDLDEVPPDSEMLSQNVTHRDLEIEYLNQSLKDYFKNLRNEIDSPLENVRRVSNDSNITKRITNIEQEFKANSPIVSVKRLSIDDISKWLPSPRNSYTDSSHSANSRVNRKETKTSTPILTERFQKSSDQENETNPTQKLEEISLESDRNYKRRSKRTKTKPVTLQYYDTEEPLKNEYHETSHNKESDKNSHDNDYEKNTNDFKEAICGNSPHPIDVKTKKNKKTKKIIEKIVEKNTQEKIVERRSMISPIKLFDEIFSNQKQSPILKKSVTRLESPFIRQKSPISRANSSKKIALSYNQEESNEKDESSSDEESNKILTEVKKVKANKKDTSKSERDTESIDSSPNLKTKLPNRNIVSRLRKRKSSSPVSPEVDYPKRKKVEDTVVTSESGPSVSSVNDWFKRNVQINRAYDINTSMRDCIENVQEKLDTTLAEIHQSTSKKLVHMFVDAQSRLSEIRNEQRKLLKAAATDILTKVVSIIDEKFSELDRRSEELHVEFTSKLKTSAQELVREDCSRKRAMVRLLREDLSLLAHAPHSSQ